MNFSKKKNFIVAVVIFVILAVTFYISKDYARGLIFGQTSGQNKTALSSELVSEPNQNADIYGMITSVDGNKITILKFDPSTMPGAKQSQSSDQQSDNGNAISLGQTSSQGGPPGGFSKSGGGPGGFGGGNSSTRQDKLEELKATSIGTETIEVPVGIPINVQAESGNLKSLTSDVIVTIWLSADSDSSGESEDSGETVLRKASYISVTGKVDMDN